MAALLHWISPYGEVGTPVRRAILPSRRGEDPLIFAALRARRFAFRRSGDACAARSKAGPVMGLRPLLGPPCIPPEAPPPKHPLRAFSISAKRRGHASYAAGASLPRSARSGDLPSRRVNAIVCFRFGKVRFSPISPTKLTAKKHR